MPSSDIFPGTVLYGGGYICTADKGTFFRCGPPRVRREGSLIFKNSVEKGVKLLKTQ